MNYNVFDMTVAGSVGSPTLTTYIIDASEAFMINERPMVIICPGGGYNHVSDREGEMLAMQFVAAGYHAAVLRYSVSPAVYPTQLLELAKAVALLRSHAKEWHIISDKILIQGSSAGGHLAMSYGCFWKEHFLVESQGGEKEILRPNGLVLSYPVITSGKYAHRSSFEMLLGSRYEELVDKMSLEHQVNRDTPKTFVWHTFEDNVVPVENTMLLIQALKKQEISFECHIYPRGGHGLSLANNLTLGVSGAELQEDVTSWIGLAKTFISNL